MNLNTKVEELPGVGPIYVKRLEKIGITNVRDLLFHFPRRYDDFSKNVTIKQIRAGECVSIKGEIWEINNKKSRRGITVTEATVADDTGTMKAVWFNQPFLIKTLKKGDKIALSGKLEWSYGGTAMSSPSYEKLDSGEQKHTGAIIPVYPETEGLTSKWLRFKIKPLLKSASEVTEHLPKEVIENQRLLGIEASIKELHFPKDMATLRRARDRVSFDEMFLLQLAVLNLRKDLKHNNASKIKFDENLIKEFVKSLSFELTEAQRKTAWEILQDLEEGKPMNRLLEGDVGSGKTVVSAIALLNTIKAGYQGILLVPTEVLAKQHFKSMLELFDKFNINIGLLTGNRVEFNETVIKKEEMLEKISSGKIDLLMGTHALFSDDIEFSNLGLVVIDEQHRFGVEQRMKLRRESGDAKTFPHFLSMTATPIPRSLTLTLYGDLDVSIIDEMPKGRERVLTRVVPPSKRKDAYGFIEKEVKSGRQVFVICPLIEESDKLGVKSAEEEYRKLGSVIFPDLRVGLLHGRLKPKEKEEVMDEFKEGKIDIIVSTSVIEVGIDVPNATIMMIEGAERFGLAQLHQFRGRVGRGEYKSYCLLFSDGNSENTERRLESLVNTYSGFELAEKDLEIRGPGEVFGTKQSGMLNIDMKNLMNINLIKKTREVAGEFLEAYDLNDFPLLKEKVEKYNVVGTLE